MITITRSPWGRRLIVALLTWIVPFLIAIPFDGKNGTLLIDPVLFKSIMIVIATITAAMLMVWFFLSSNDRLHPRGRDYRSCRACR